MDDNLKVPVQAFDVDSAPEHVTGHGKLIDGFLKVIVNQEITEMYDQAEALLNRISVSRVPELVHELETAKNALFRARTLTDGSPDGA